MTSANTLSARAATPLTLVTEDGFPLAARRWHAVGKLRGVVLVAAATGVRQRLYAPFAAFLAGEGFEVVTWDWRGIGESFLERGPRDPRITMRAWAEQDLGAAIEWADRFAEGLPVSVVGHSFGGAAIGLAANASRLDRAVLVAAQHGWWGHWPRATWWWLLPVWFLIMPLSATLLGKFPAASLGRGEDLPVGVARDWSRWCRRKTYLGDWRGHAAMRQPILSIAFTDDRIAPRRAVHALLAEFRRADIIARYLSPDEMDQPAIGHWGFFRAGTVSGLWQEVAAFLQGG